MSARIPAATPSEFARVYRKHHTFVWHALRSLGVADSVLDDAMQDTFVVVHRRLSEFEGRAALRTWIFEIARRVALRYRTRAVREAARTSELPELPNLRDGDDLDAAVERTLAGEVLRAFVDSLDEDRLRVFMLSEFGELRGREIAEQLGLNLNTVYARLRSAHRDLDRLAARLRAKERTVMLASLRSAQQNHGSSRRVWSLLTLKLGLRGPTLKLVPIGWAGPAKTMGIAGAVAGAVIAIVAIARAPVPTEVMVRNAEASTETEPRPTAPTQAPRARAVSPTRLPATVHSQPQPQPQPKPKPKTQRDITFTRASATLGHTRPSAVQVRPNEQLSRARPSSAEPDLAAEVVLVQAIRRAVAGERPVADAVRRYMATFPEGALQPEVSALQIEHDCKQGASKAASERAIVVYVHRWPGSSLVARLRRVCGPKIAAQKPGG